MSLTIAADNREYLRLQAFVESACAESGCSAIQRLRVLLVVEELFTNTVKYGQRADAPVSITIGIVSDGTREVTIRYQDDGPRHDPFETAGPAPDLTASVPDRPVGGLGVVLVRELGRGVRYEWSGGRNSITFLVPGDPPARIDP